MRLLVALVVLLLCGNDGNAQLTQIDFGSADSDLPYAEDDIIFSSVTGTAVIRGFQGDFRLTTGGTLTGELRIRAESVKPFDLNGLEVERLNQAWRIETSAGGVYAIPTTGILEITGQQGFSKITRIDFVNDGGVLNASLYVDDIRLTFVPEPATSAMLGLLSAPLLLHRRRISATSTPACVFR